MGGNFQAIKRQIDSFAQELALLASLHQAYAGEWRTLSEALAEAARKAENELASYDRLANKVPGRQRAEFCTIAAGQLPSLNERHVKFYENKDRQLKSLQKTVLKEQSDVLGMLDIASAGFEKLLVEASQASLQAAAPR
jgi:hypothetical protein